jgi:hypothetical protein
VAKPMQKPPICTCFRGSFRTSRRTWARSSKFSRGRFHARRRSAGRARRISVAAGGATAGATPQPSSRATPV